MASLLVPRHFNRRSGKSGECWLIICISIVVNLNKGPFDGVVEDQFGLVLGGVHSLCGVPEVGSTSDLLFVETLTDRRLLVMVESALDSPFSLKRLQVHPRYQANSLYRISMVY